LMELEKLRARFFDAETGEAALNDWWFSQEIDGGFSSHGGAKSPWVFILKCFDLDDFGVRCLENSI
jgi:hypothetical protein